MWYTVDKFFEKAFASFFNGRQNMTIILRNVDYQFLNIIESILPLRQDVQIETEYEEPNELTEKVMKDTENGKNLSPVFNSTSDFMAALNA